MIIALNRTVGPVKLDCVISESLTTALSLTTNPIESGADVTDHAFIEPKKVTLEIGDGDAAGTFNALVRFQESRIPFTLVTGLTVIPNMMVKQFNVDRDSQFSTILKGSIDLQEIIIVDTAYAAPEAGDEAPKGGQPGGKQSTRAASPSASRASDEATAVRTSGTVQRGDTPSSHAPLIGGGASAVQNRSILSSMFGS